MYNNILKIYLLVIISFLVGTSQFIIAGVLDKISISLNISISTAGQLVTIFALASAIGTPILSILISKYNQKNQLILALIIFLIGIFLTPISNNLDFLLIARAITGVGSSLFVVVSYTLASQLAKEGKQGSAMSNIALGFSLALVLGVPLGRAVTNFYDWHMIFYIIGVLVFIGLIFIFFIIPNVKGKEKIPLKEQIKLLKNKKVVHSLTITLFVFITFSIISTFITPLLFSIEKIEEHKIGIIFLVLGIASVIGSKLGASLADKIGIPLVLTTTMLIIIITSILMFIFSDSLFIVTILLTIWTLAIWMFGPTQSFNLSKLIPKVSSILLSLNSSFVQLGFAIGAFLGGIVINLLSIKFILIIAAIGTFIALLIYLQKENKK